MKHFIILLTLLLTTTATFAQTAEPAREATPQPAPNTAQAAPAETPADGEASEEKAATTGKEQGKAKSKEVKKEEAKTKAEPPKDITPYPFDTCIVTDNELGSMGDPVTFIHEKQEIKVCCKPCEEKFKKNPGKYLPKLTPQE